VTRWEHQDVLDDMQEQLEWSPDAMRIWCCSVEHPFKTIKSWMGVMHFLTKGLECVKTEMRLHVLAYNVKLLMSLLGLVSMIKAMRAYPFLLRLQRVFGMVTLLTRSVSQKRGTAP
jgi:transposase